MTSKSDQLSTWADQVVEATYRSDWGRLLSLLVARTRRLDLAEDALSEAFSRASVRWGAEGVPANPPGWLYTAAYRVIVGQLRAEAIHGRKVRSLAVRPDWVEQEHHRDLTELDDERLALILLCCHPALSPDTRSPLALRLVMGTSTDEIARLFVVSRSTMAARLTRAKKRIVAAGIPLSAPVDDELRARLDDVCRTIYLAFTAGYAPSAGPDLLRIDLAGEAVELAGILVRLVPEARQVRALYGLLLLQHARRHARVTGGRLATLAAQDRSLWEQDEIRSGTELVLSLPPDIEYAEELRLQGLIAVEHTRSATAAATDWPALSALYSNLEAITGSPIVRLNHAVAVGEADGPQAGLDLIEDLDALLPEHHRLHAVRADLYRRSGQIATARSCYLAAIDLCTNDVERQYLSDQLSALTPPTP